MQQRCRPLYDANGALKANIFVGVGQNDQERPFGVSCTYVLDSCKSGRACIIIIYVRDTLCFGPSDDRTRQA
jgi:hypothetical protein